MLRHPLETACQVDDGTEDGDLHLLRRANFPGDGAAVRDADPDLEAAQGMVRPAECFTKGGTNPQCGPTRGDRRFGGRERPAPKSHRGIALKVARHTSLFQDLARHHAESPAHTIQEPPQVSGFGFGFLAESPQVAEKNGDVALARFEEGRVEVVSQRGEDRRREKLP